MKIILVLTNSQRRNLVFITDKLNSFSIKKGQVDKVHIVHREDVVYLRTNREVPKQWELESLSISSFQLFFSVNNLDSKLFRPLADYLIRYQDTFDSSNQDIIRISGLKMVTKDKVKEKLQSHKK